MRAGIRRGQPFACSRGYNIARITGVTYQTSVNKQASMSRAFVKELDGDQPGEDLPERPQSPHPQYVTPHGLCLLNAELQQLRARRTELLALGEDMAAATQLRQVERDLRYIEHCVQNAIVVDAARQPHADVRFGASVALLDEDANTHRFAIVGEHEACASKGQISWVSPLARSLIGRRVGDVVVWERPAGNIELEITEVSYPDSPSPASPYERS